MSAASSFGSTLVDEGGSSDGQTPIETLRIHGTRHVLTVACFDVDQLKGYLVFSSRDGDDLSQIGRKSVDQGGAGTGQSGQAQSKSPSPPPQPTVMTSNESNRSGAVSPGLEEGCMGSQNVQGGKVPGETYVKGEDLVCGLNPKLNELIRDCVNCISGAAVKKKK